MPRRCEIFYLTIHLLYSPFERMYLKRPCDCVERDSDVRMTPRLALERPVRTIGTGWPAEMHMPEPLPSPVAGGPSIIDRPPPRILTYTT